MNIILIGMPACGKSTVGVVLAKTLGIGFTDTDLIIQQRENRLLQEIIDSDGIEHFLDVEAQAVKSLNCDNFVVATGGSVVFRDDAVKHLKKNGTFFYLDVPVEEIKRRLDNINTRGVAAQKGKSIEDIFTERTPLYKKYADYVIDLSDSSIEKTVEKISEILKK